MGSIPARAELASPGVPLKHVVLTRPSFHGYEYGMLRDFEDEVIRITNGEKAYIPPTGIPAFIARRVHHGMRYAPLRKLLPKSQFNLKADILWVILMGAEDYSLDLYEKLGARSGFKILYLFDTFERQLPTLRTLLKSTDWDLTITSFRGAVPLLENATQRKWYDVPQGVMAGRFKPEPLEARLIDFSSFGRRHEVVHEGVKSFCKASAKYYEYSTSSGIRSNIDSQESYGHYGWHLAHSSFTFSWPVEVTNPSRVTNFSPITCRWFEAAASGTPIIGQAPSERQFEELFGSESVIPIKHRNLSEALEEIWGNRSNHLQVAEKRRRNLISNWTWESRVNDILRLAESSIGSSS